MGGIGYIEEVNGFGAREIQGFAPTRHELLQLAKYWVGVAVRIEYFWFLYDQVGSSDIRLQPFAWRRVARIEDLLGREEVHKIVDEVYDEFGQTADKRAWEAFRHGTDQERQAIRDEIRALQKADEKGDLPL